MKKAADWGAWTEAGFRAQIDLCLQALEIDADYAEAHAHLGWGYYELWWLGYDSREENRSKARTAAEKALELDPTKGTAHHLPGHLSRGDCDWAGAEARYVRVLKARPRHGGPRSSYGYILLATGRAEEAEIQLRTAVRLDPAMG